MNEVNLAPIVLFAYKRPYELKQAISRLQANHLASASELYVFADGPKTEAERPKIQAVREVVEQITGFREVHRVYADHNQGLGEAIIAGVSKVIDQHGKVIVLEDDLLPTANFLDFMNHALTHYQHQASVFSVAGYTFPFPHPTNYPHDAYLYGRTGSWGWATWADRWQGIDWQLTDYDEFITDPIRCQAFAHYGSDRLRMLRRWKTGQIDSWAIRWCYAQAKANALTVYPTESKIDNIGFSADSTNTNVYNRYRTTLDSGTKRQFNFPEATFLSDYYSRRMRWKFSVPMRISNRLLTHAMEMKHFFSTSNS